MIIIMEKQKYHDNNLKRPKETFCGYAKSFLLQLVLSVSASLSQLSENRRWFYVSEFDYFRNEYEVENEDVFSDNNRYET